MTRRYTTTADTAVHEECWLGAAGEVRTYWTPSGGGYVREISRTRPGTLGHHVCDRLAHMGSTLSSSRGALLGLIRSEARACLRAEAIEEARW